MTGKTTRRTVPVKMWSVLLVGLALLGALGAWLTFGRDTAAPCNGLPEDGRVQKSVGADVHPGMSCAALGQAIVKATAAEQGRHSQAQAQAVKDVLFSPGLGYTKNLRIDPALRVPLATVLADYAVDTHEMLAGLDSQYVFKMGPADAPWESSGTYHLAVEHLVFRNVVRAVSQDPQAYAILRLAETRYAAQQLAAVPGDATGAAFSLPPTKNARALGILDGLTDGYARDQAWRTAVHDGLLREPTTQGSYQENPSAYLTATWLQGLRNTPEAELANRLRTQGVDIARAWTQARNTDESTRQDLLAEVDRSALSAYSEAKP
ncbi:hypothetical protein [Streptomyces sp. NBC_00503]|uniref:hypothetical protein n=1 Tax=Streptomyces sp. NBC_00503 TaxID=2903659 RepID=UPI002E8243FD|nr:hypothetical protein [Streptomyces sp. NBC_00503]WUD83608.1 hypothetical protein OG490_25340 [Streptomyces sp. NBC_00503]